MSATATRKRPAKVVTREETAKRVADSTTTAEATARELAASFAAENMSKDERLFEQARIAFAGIATGAKAPEIATATTNAVAETFIESDREWARNTSVVNGGAKVTRVTIQQRADAYSAILQAGIDTPTVALVTVAFRAFTSKGAPGLADAHKALIKETLNLPEDERASHYAENARPVADSVVARKKEAAKAGNSEKAATRSADRKAEGASVTFEEGMTADDVVKFIRDAVALKWSDDERATIMAALSEIVNA